MRESDAIGLVRAARQGNAAAFAQLVSHHYPALLGSCQRMVGDRELARDAAQEATLRALLGLDHLREDARFGAWLIGIGLNVCRGLLVAGARQVSLDALREGGHLSERVAEGAEPVELIARGELAVRVRDAIAALPPGQRRAVALFYIGGLTRAEVAEELGTPPGAVKTRLHKARSTLRASLRDTYEEYIAMTDPSTHPTSDPTSDPSNHPTSDPSELIPMHVAALRRTTSHQRHIVVLEDASGRRLPIWIGSAEATAMALILERVEMPRPGVHQLAVALLAGAGGRLREVRITDLTESVFYAQAVLADGTRIDARPSDALTLALLSGVPIYVAAGVLETEMRSEYLDEANAAVDASRAIAEEAQARLDEIRRTLQPGT